MDDRNSELVEHEPAETVNTVLAAQARGRGASELWTSAIGGGMNAALLWTQFPSFHWLAAGFAAVGAYGVWGLLDRKLSVLGLQDIEPRGSLLLVLFVRGLTAAGGWAAAALAIFGFLTAALGGLSIPGR